MATALSPTLGFFTEIVYDTFHEASEFCVAGLATFRTVGNAGCLHAYSVSIGVVPVLVKRSVRFRKPPFWGGVPVWQFAAGVPATFAGMTMPVTVTV